MVHCNLSFAYKITEIDHKNNNTPTPTVAALHQGAPGQMTWLEDPPPWLPSRLRPTYCFALLR